MKVTVLAKAILATKAATAPRGPWFEIALHQLHAEPGPRVHHRGAAAARSPGGEPQQAEAKLPRQRAARILRSSTEVTS